MTDNNISKQPVSNPIINVDDISKQPVSNPIINVDDISELSTLKTTLNTVLSGDNISKQSTLNTTHDTTSDNESFTPVFVLNESLLTDDILDTTDNIDNILKNSSNKLKSQVPIIIEDKSINSSRLPLIDIENPNQILTNVTNQNTNGMFNFN